MRALCKYKQLFFAQLKYLWAIILCVVFFNISALNAQKKPDDIIIELSRQTNTLYNILNQITRQSGYFFIYDSELVNSDKKISIGATKKSLPDILQELVKAPSLEYKVIDNHILLYRPSSDKTKDRYTDSIFIKPDNIIIQGRTIDHENGNPIPSASLNIKNTSQGVSTNANGLFRFQLPEEYINDTLVFSHIGYRARQIPVSILKQGFVDVALEFDFITLEGVTISAFKPSVVIQKALSSKSENYPNKPINNLSFYREGIFIEDKLMSYSEALVREYKPPFESKQDEQMAVLQSRIISNINREDTLVFRLRSGIEGATQMDIVKHVPDFLDNHLMHQYEYNPVGITIVNGRNTYVIDFEQKENIKFPLHKGALYIDKESFAIVHVDFEINRQYIRQIQSRFIPRPNPDYTIYIQSAEYKVSYKLHNDKYFLNHVKGELVFRVRPKFRLFSRYYRIFFEKAIVNNETENVQRIRRREAVKRNIIFSEQAYSYDYDFWGDYFVITPEKEIHETLKTINNKIESLIYE